MGLLPATLNMTAGWAAGSAGEAGGGRGGAFGIQTGLRQAGGFAGESDGANVAGGAEGDTPSFEAVLQATAHGQDAGPAAASDTGSASAAPQTPGPASPSAKSSSGEDADQTGAHDGDRAQDTQDTADQASSADSQAAQAADGSHQNKSQAGSGKDKQDTGGKDDTAAAQGAAAAQDVAATLAIQAGSAAANQAPAQTAASDGDSSQANASAGGSALPVPTTLAHSIERAIALHQVVPAPGKAAGAAPRGSSGKDASSPAATDSLKSQAKEEFLHVAESKLQAGPPAQAEAAAAESPAAQRESPAQGNPAWVSNAGQKEAGQAAENNAVGQAQAEDSAAAVAASAPVVHADDADSRGIAATVNKLATVEAARPAGNGLPVTLTGALGAAPQAGGGAESASGAQESPPASSSETLDQIVLGLKGQMDPKTGKAQILLDPPNLGQVKVSLSLANGVLTAQFESSTGAVRDLLKSNLDKLKTVLQGQGIAVDRLAVDAPAAGDAGTAGGQMQQNAYGSAAHDGRSAGGFGQEARSGQDRWQQQGGKSFAQLFAQSQQAPIDLVA